MNRTIKIADRPAIIHVNRHFIAANHKDGGARPVYTIKYCGETVYAREVEVEGKTKAVYNGDRLSCGARAWLEALEGTLTLIDPCSYGEAKHAGR